MGHVTSQPMMNENIVLAEASTSSSVRRPKRSETHPIDDDASAPPICSTAAR